MRGGFVTVRGRTLLDVAADDYSSPATREEARALMRALIGERLHGQILHTRTVLRELSDL
jgi:DNA repair protein RecO (recombination protein O)